MAFVLQPRKTFTSTANNHTYSFISIPPTIASCPTLLFLHGFPSQIYDWTPQIAYFSSRGYGVVAVDLIGYGQSSKHDDPSEYRLKVMSDDLNKLLDSLDLKSVVGIGHDIGATLLSRMVAYQPDRWSALVFIAVGPPRMGTSFDLDAINAMTKQFLGFELLGYMSWLSGEESNEVQRTLEEHAESMMSLVFAEDSGVWNEWFRPLGKMKQFVTEDQRVKIGSWYSEYLRKHHLEAFSCKDGYKGAVKWYQMWRKNLFLADEVGYEGFKAHQPVLFIGDNNSGQQRGMLQDWMPNLNAVELQTGHWIHLECADKVNKEVEGFLKSHNE